MDAFRVRPGLPSPRFRAHDLAEAIGSMPGIGPLPARSGTRVARPENPHRGLSTRTTGGVIAVACPMR